MNNTKKITFSALFLSIGLILPFFTGQIPEIGQMLLPMHIPVLICGIVCGGPCGLIVGLILPLLRSVLFGMPNLMPSAIAMAFELATYGFVAGVLYQTGKQTKMKLYMSLIGAMISGRIIWGLASMLLYRVLGMDFTWQVFVAGAFLNAIPGIIAQFVFIPPIVMGIKRMSYSVEGRRVYE